MSGTAVLPKLGLLYRATPEWSVFGQYATGYRALEAGRSMTAFAPKPCYPAWAWWTTTSSPTPT